jgi:hypothetical protein
MSGMSDPRGDREDDAPGGLPVSAKLPEIEPPPDFLAGVQAKIHKRSGGKFYRSRWATSPMSTLVQIVSLAMLLAIVLIWLLSSPVRGLGPDTAAPDGGQGLRPPVKIQSSGSGSLESPPSPPPH